MTLKPIDSHCHLFSAKYAVEEAAAMGWAYVTGNYPHAEAALRAAAETESLFSWDRLAEAVKWFFDLAAALNGYEENRASLEEAARKGLGLPADTKLPCLPLMMDIFYMFGPPAGPVPGAMATERRRQVRRSLKPEDREASEAAYRRFQQKVKELAKARAKGKPGAFAAGVKAPPVTLAPADIDRIFSEAKGKGALTGVMKGLAPARELSRGFAQQIEDLIALQERHPGEVFPLLALDPRRRGVTDLALRGVPELNQGKPLVSSSGPFFGIKLYTRLGYLPADVGDELYSFCETEGLPVVVHTSFGGFPPGANWRYAAFPEPRHWEAVLRKHPGLHLDFAHFGNGSPDWVTQILGLMNGYPHVYADLACYTGAAERAEAFRLWSQEAILRERLLFGTDFVISILTQVLSLEGYFQAFRDLFGPAALEALMSLNPSRFLEAILPAGVRVTAPEPYPATAPASEEKLRRRLGWLPDLPDHRDHTVETDAVPRHILRLNRQQTVKAMLGKIDGALKAVKGRKAAVPLPRRVDLRPWCSPVEDQGELGACTAHAAAGLIEYYERRAFGSYIDISRLFLYKATRNLLNWTGDTGAYLRTTMEAMVLFGVPPEAYFPYEPANVDTEPTAFCYSFAQNYQTLDYFRLDAGPTTRPELLQRVRESLAKGIPAMFGFTVFSSIGHAARTGRIPFPAKADRREGGHAVAAVGYDDALAIRHPYTGMETKGAILIRNSWGRSWGEAGYGWLPYEYVLHGLAIDWWTVLKQEWVDTNRFQESP